MKLSKLKFSIKDLLIAILIVSPLVFIVISSFHPVERALEKEDEERKNMVNALVRATDQYVAKYSRFPKDASSLKSEGIIDWLPENPEEYLFLDNGTDLIVYSKAESLTFREYCSGQTTNILYSSKDKRTDLVCGDNPAPGEQRFVN